MDRFVIRKSSGGGNGEDGTSTSSSSNKRIKLGDEQNKEADVKTETEQKPIKPPELCSYGEKCYRKNIHHFREYRHPHLEVLLQEMESIGNLSEVPGDRINKELLLEQIQAVKKFGYKPWTVNKAQFTEESCSQNTVNVSASIANLRTVVSGVPEEQAKITKKLNDPNMTPYEKWKLAEPFNMFLTSIGPEKTYFSLSFTDLFHPSFGQVKSVCHINFMIEAEWFMDQIVSSDMWDKPTTIIYGTENPGIENITKYHDWVESFRAKSPHIFGHHHTKMSLIEYEDKSVRFAVYTANLIESDWMNKTQGVWVSPRCPPLEADSDRSVGESPTGFRNDMVAYLLTYQLKELERWVKLIRTTDCREIKVVFVASAPNLVQSIGSNGFQWGIKKVEQVLRKHQTQEINSQWPIIAQCSSIGSLGPDDTWLRNEWGFLLEGPVKTKPSVKLVYPTVSDVKNSADGEEGADCLPYGNETHSKQRWLEGNMCKWVGFTYNRTFAMPHVKTYCRVSPDYKKMAWFILTSANLSKAAWGKLNKKKDQLLVMSWECGVMFLPKFMTGSNVFEGQVKAVDNGSKASSRVAADRRTVVYDFPVPYDLPVTPYTGANKPWLVDYLLHARRKKPT